MATIVSVIERHVIKVINSDMPNTEKARKIIKFCRRELLPKREKHITSKYRGVSKQPSGRYHTQINYHKANIFIGSYMTEHEAAYAYNLKAIELFGEYATLNEVAPVILKPIIKPRKTSKYIGVSRDGLKWAVKLSYKGKFHCHGYYHDEKEAALKYNEVVLKLKGNNAKLNKIF